MINKLDLLSKKYEKGRQSNNVINDYSVCVKVLMRRCSCYKTESTTAS